CEGSINASPAIHTRCFENGVNFHAAMVCRWPRHGDSGFARQCAPVDDMSTAHLAGSIPRPTGEGTARPVARSFQSAWIGRPAKDDPPIRKNENENVSSLMTLERY